MTNVPVIPPYSGVSAPTPAPTSTVPVVPASSKPYDSAFGLNLLSDPVLAVSSNGTIGGP